MQWTRCYWQNIKYKEAGKCILQHFTDHCQAHENWLADFAAAWSVTFEDIHSVPSCSTFQMQRAEQSWWNSGLFWSRAVQSCRVRHEQARPAVLRCWEPGPATAFVPCSGCESATFSHPQKAQMRFWLKEHIARGTWLFKHWFLSYFPALHLLSPSQLDG